MGHDHDHEDESAKKGFRVVDRRRFTEDGEARADVTTPEPAPKKSAGVDAPPPKTSPFVAFIASLATNALGALGKLPEGMGQNLPRSNELAREYIEILTMLQEKTRGNLDSNEAEVLQRFITDLRLAYVEAAK